MYTATWMCANCRKARATVTAVMPGCPGCGGEDCGHREVIVPLCQPCVDRLSASVLDTALEEAGWDPAEVSIAFPNTKGTALIKGPEGVQ